MKPFFRYFLCWMLFVFAVCPGGQSTGEITLGRSIRSYMDPGQNTVRVQLALSVFNLTGKEIQDVLVKDRFVETASSIDSSLPYSRMGEDYVWCLGSIPAQDYREVVVDLEIPGLAAGDAVDQGAAAAGVYYLIPVSATASPAVALDIENLAPYLQATMDANANDPYVRRKAAELGHRLDSILDYGAQSVDFELYEGSLRGARGTLWSQAGNALDRSSLLVALLRASGIPARYAQGEIPEASASALIASMFEFQPGQSGLLPEGLPLADPASRSELIAEATGHSWIEYWSQGEWMPFDPSLRGANLSATPYIDPATVYAEVPDALRHKIHFRTTVELLSQFNTLDISHPIDLTLRTVETVGEPITVGHSTQNRQEGGILGVGGFLDYKPFVASGDNILQGTPFHEQWYGTGIYELSKHFLIAEWLDIGLESPRGTMMEFRRTILDRLGYVRREKGQRFYLTDFEGNPPSKPALSELDFFTLYAPVSKTDPSVVEKIRREVQDLRTRLDALSPQLADVDEENPSAEDLRIIRQANLLVSELATQATRLVGTYFVLRSDELGENAARGFGVRSYLDSPRLIIANTALDGTNLKIRLDIRRGYDRAIPAPGQTSFVDFFYRTTRGRIDGALEGVALANASGATSELVHSTFTVMRAALDQGIDVVQVGDPEAVNRLNISEEAQLRVKKAIEAGKAVQIPVRSPQVNGEAAIAWWETDGITGETYAVTEDGGHQLVIEYPVILLGNANTIIGAEVGVLFGSSNTFLNFIGNFLKNFNASHDAESAIVAAKNSVAYNAVLTCAGTVNPGVPELIDGAAELLDDTPSFADYLSRALPRAAQTALQAALGGFGTGFGIGQCIGEMIANAWLADVFEGDPPLPPFYIDTHAFEPSPVRYAETTGSGRLGTGFNAIQSHSSLNRTQLIQIQGMMSLGFVPGGGVGLPIDRLSASSAEVRNSSGELLGSGSIDLTGLAGSLAGIETADAVALSGAGRLATLPLSESGLAAGSQWDSFTVQATGNVKVNLHAAVKVGATNLPLGDYSIISNAVNLSGSGSAALACGAARLDVTPEACLVGVGEGNAIFTSGFLFLQAGAGISFATFSGNLTVLPGDVTFDQIQTNATIGDYLQMYAIASGKEGNDFLYTLDPAGQEIHEVRARVEGPAGWGSIFEDNTLDARLTPDPLATPATYSPRFFVESSTLPGLIAQAKGNVAIENVAAGLSVTITHEPDRMISRQGAKIPGVFEIAIQGQSPDVLTANLVPGGAPSGQALLSASEVTIKGFQPAYSYLYLTPDEPLPASGSVYTVGIQARSSGLDPVSATTVWVIPEIRAGRIYVDRGAIFTSQPQDVPVEVTVKNSGNVQGNFTLTAIAPTGFKTPGILPPGLLQPAESHTQTLHLGSFLTTPGLAGAYLLQARRGGELVYETGVSIQVLGSKAAAAAYMAGEAARQKGRFSLWQALTNLGGALEELEKDLGSESARDLAVAALNAVRDGLGEDFAGFDSELSALASSIQAASGQSLIPLLSDLAEVLERLKSAIEGAPSLLGDLNGDGLFDWRDLFIYTRTWLLTPPRPIQADISEDGKVGTEDILLFRELLR